ncbi:hypothetical protein ADM90_02980 [Lysinibacillus macroides]|uniref:Uncharacterized protein n=1 Tax=Lysinibacillus macroides TaxID=33935 RepID=A0A0N0UW17_9BACI|nr:hypothetical protein ADM90_21955 [Lysinibacillus macroides]KOY83727.1 hypothetical protein ADM90_02980 [Lysinibacillus macroides]
MFNNPDRMHPTVLSKSLSNYLHYYLLDLMESAAEHEEYILVPFSCFTWRRIRALKDMNYFSFKVGQESYFMVNPLDLKQLERIKLESYLNELKWN